MSRDYGNHRLRVAATNARSYELNRDLRLWESRQRTLNNPAATYESKRRWKVVRRDRYLEVNRAYGKRKRKCPFFRASKAISKSLWDCFHEKKDRRKWQSVLGYTFDEVKTRLESLFQPGMTWVNYGTFWEIDHDVPLSWFDLSDPGQFQHAWELSNLKPEYIPFNRSKGNRFSG
jgi:hypothetical protein